MATGVTKSERHESDVKTTVAEKSIEIERLIIKCIDALLYSSVVS